MDAAVVGNAWWGDLRAELVDLVLPRHCVGCDRPGHVLCPRCAPALRGAGHRRDPRPRPPGLPAAFVAGPYAGVLRAAVLHHKERGQRDLTGPLGAALAAAVAAAVPAGPVALVPIPTSAAAVAARGDDTVLLLARAAARVLRRAGWAARVVRALRPARRRADQAGLDAAARRRNLAGAFAVRPHRLRAIPPAVPVVVVDDVVTTGATMRAAVLRLAAAGVPVPAVAAVAGTVRRHPPATWDTAHVGG